MRGHPDGADNFRDLGGLRCADGRTIRPGLLFRSGHLGRLTDDGAHMLLDRLDIRTVADLRTSEETACRPDRRIVGVAYDALPSLTEDQNPAITRESRNAVLRRIMAVPGGARAYLRDTYRTLVTSPLALRSHRALIDLLLDTPDGGVLWHCTQGKDRAGMATAVVLLALGADRETILEDYLRSNRSFRWKNLLYFIGIAVFTLRVRAARNLNQLLTARREYLDAAFGALEERWGGTDGFLHDALGLTDDALARLRDKYLIA